MATAISSAALTPVTAVFSNTERLALAGFLAGYSGLTRQAYEAGLAPVRRLVPVASTVARPGPPGGHRVLRPRSGSPRQGAGHHHPAAPWARAVSCSLSVIHSLISAG